MMESRNIWGRQYREGRRIAVQAVDPTALPIAMALPHHSNIPIFQNSNEVL